MGLDITAYTRTERVGGYEGEEIGHADPGVGISQAILDWSNDQANFPGTPRGEGLTAGTYTYEDSFDFKAGSYGGYNGWREALAQLVGWADDNEAFKSPAPPTDSPRAAFWELIMFADNEGVIGPVVSKKLAKDFADWMPQASREPSWFLDLYNRWKGAFQMASDNGFVDFH